MILSHYAPESESKPSNYLYRDGHTWNTVPQRIVCPRQTCGNHVPDRTRFPEEHDQSYKQSLPARCRGEVTHFGPNCHRTPSSNFKWLIFVTWFIKFVFI